MFKKLKFIPLFVLTVGLLMSFSSKAQVVIQNNTACVYKVKVNVRPTGVCNVNGFGPVVIVPAFGVVSLPAPVVGNWVPAFGVNEISPIAAPLPPFIVGDNMVCGLYPNTFGPYGTCGAVATYVNPLLLVIN